MAVVLESMTFMNFLSRGNRFGLRSTHAAIQNAPEDGRACGVTKG
jgi:hypothetical protein